MDGYWVTGPRSGSARYTLHASPYKIIDLHGSSIHRKAVSTVMLPVTDTVTVSPAVACKLILSFTPGGFHCQPSTILLPSPVKGLIFRSPTSLHSTAACAAVEVFVVLPRTIARESYLCWPCACGYRDLP